MKYLVFMNFTRFNLFLLGTVCVPINLLNSMFAIYLSRILKKEMNAENRLRNENTDY